MNQPCRNCDLEITYDTDSRLWLHVATKSDTCSVFVFATPSINTGGATMAPTEDPTPTTATDVGFDPETPIVVDAEADAELDTTAADEALVGALQPPVERTGMQQIRSVDLQNDGLLYLINREVFHPRGYSLGLAAGEDGISAIVLVGDGSQPVGFGEDVDEQALFDAAKALLK